MERSPTTLAGRYELVEVVGRGGMGEVWAGRDLRLGRNVAVSLSCTLPVFLAVVATTFGDASVVSGMATYVAYALGMGTVLTGLAVATAIAHGTLTTAFRRAVPAEARLGGLLLVIAGAYVSWYAVYEIRLERNDDAAAGPAVAVTRWSGQVSNWVNEVGPGWIAVGAVMLLGVALVVGRVRERRVTGSDRTDAGH